jgi:hypothetical protein
MHMRKLGWVAGVLLVAGCATIVKGTTQSIVVNTPGAPGSMCTLSSSDMGTQSIMTPASITVGKSKENISVMCQKECYQDGIAVIVSNTEAMTAGNIILGGVVGLGVDAATGAMNKYAGETSVMMIPIQGCKRKK